MVISRRDFLSGLAASFVSVDLKLQSAPARGNSQGSLIQLFSYGQLRNQVTEGKSVLAAVNLPFEVEEITGQFPVEITPTSLEGKRMTEQQRLYFYPASNQRTYRTLLAAPLDAIPQLYNVDLRWRREAFEESASLPFSVKRGEYRSSAFRLHKSFSSPTPQVAEIRQREFLKMAEIYKRVSSRRWTRPFVQPVNSNPRLNFGDRRTVNSTKRYRHAGLVYAVNDGTVALSATQYNPGETICLDHGSGIFSRYIHLSQRVVEEGEIVQRGQLIGYSGNTGGQRPGPHLHMDIILNCVHVDPLQFFHVTELLLTLEAQESISRT
jgi:hypothetical protein